jgi:hypothetical protein
MQLTALDAQMRNQIVKMNPNVTDEEVKDFFDFLKNLFIM